MAGTNILNTRKINYLEMIGNGRSYRVPPYQRDYSWSEEHWEDLWNHIADLRSRCAGRTTWLHLAAPGAAGNDMENRKTCRHPAPEASPRTTVRQAVMRPPPAVHSAASGRW